MNPPALAGPGCRAGDAVVEQQPSGAILDLRNVKYAGSSVTPMCSVSPIDERVELRLRDVAVVAVNGPRPSSLKPSFCERL